jgi:hypothetical protein
MNTTNINSITLSDSVGSGAAAANGTLTNRHSNPDHPSHSPASSTFAAAAASSRHRTHEDDLGHEDDLSSSPSSFLRSENRQVRQIRKVMILVLFTTSALVTFATYYTARANQRKQLNTVYHSEADLIIDHFVESVHYKLNAMDSLSTDLTTYANVKKEVWPFVTVGDFPTRGASVTSLVSALSVTLVPLVASHQREQWQTYVQRHAPDWIVPGLALEQVLEERRDAEAQAARRRDRRIRQMATTAVSLDEIMKGMSPDIFHVVEQEGEGGITEQVRVNSTAVTVIAAGGNEETTVEDNLHYFPIWQSVPVVPELINFDVISSTHFQDGLVAMLTSRKAVIGRVTEVNTATLATTTTTSASRSGEASKRISIQDTKKLLLQTFLASTSTTTKTTSQDDPPHDHKEELQETPVSKIYVPVFHRQQRSGTVVSNNDNNDGTPTIVAVLTAIVFWESYLTNILEPMSPPFLVVLENTCGQVHSYLVRGTSNGGGSESGVTYLGRGDHHDASLFSGNIQDYVHSTEPGWMQWGDTTSSFYNGYCPYTLRVYPTREFVDFFHKNDKTPIYLMSVVIAIFFLTSLLFFFYDVLVERRQRKVFSKAQRADTIVQSLFPGM